MEEKENFKLEEESEKANRDEQKRDGPVLFPDLQQLHQDSRRAGWKVKNQHENGGDELLQKSDDGR